MNMPVKNDVYVGAVFDSNGYGAFTVVSECGRGKQGNKLYLVEFIDTGYVKHGVEAGTIRRGRVKDPYRASVFGVGYFGEGRYKAKEGRKNTLAYSTWKGMLKRCYCPKYLTKFPTYEGCEVCPEWHNYQNFGDWFEEHYESGKQLDKDLMADGLRGKLYSPETCLFLTPHQNTLVSNGKACFLLSPRRARVSTPSISEMGRKHGLHQSNLVKVVNGKRSHVQGYRLPKPEVRLLMAEQALKRAVCDIEKAVYKNAIAELTGATANELAEAA